MIMYVYMSSKLKTISRKNVAIRGYEKRPAASGKKRLSFLENMVIVNNTPHFGIGENIQMSTFFLFWLRL